MTANADDCREREREQHFLTKQNTNGSNLVLHNMIKIIMFLIILCILLYYIFNVLWLDKNSISYFYKEPKDSIDVVYIGGSNVFRHFIPTLAYDKYGYTTGILGSSTQPFVVAKYLIKESEKYQKPRLYIIDISRVSEFLGNFDDATIRKLTDAMKFSQNRIDIINKLLKYNNAEDDEYINYYFSFFMYHNRWKNINNINFDDNNSELYKGFFMSTDTIKIVPQENFTWSEKVSKLPEENKDILMDLLNYVKSNNIDVLFVMPKRFFSEKVNEYTNDAINIIQDNGFKVLNFNIIEDTNINYSTDYYDLAHLNVYGATKYTLYFAKYLKENYDLPDHRNDKLYSPWESEYERFKSNFNKLTNRNFSEFT